MAEAVLRDQVERAGLHAGVIVDSAGTGDWHVRDGMNTMPRRQLTRNGYGGESHRARQFRPSVNVKSILCRRYRGPGLWLGVSGCEGGGARPEDCFFAAGHAVVD
jgi:hypothetical protein